MNVGSLKLDGLQNTLQELLEKQKEQLAEQLPGDAQAMAAAAPAVDSVSLSSRQVLAQASSSIMSRSFVKSGSAADNMSDYVQANLAAAEAAQTLAQSLTKNVVSFLGAVGVMDPTNQTKTQAGAHNAVQAMAGKTSGEAHERNLDEIKERIEEKTEEAMAPTDANGNPVKIGAEGGEVLSAEIELAPEPQAASIAPPAPAADLPESSLPEASAAAPRAPSIDLVV